MKENELIIIRGISGSGKTTEAETNYPNHEHFEADMFFIEEGEYKFNPQMLPQAHQWCQIKVHNALELGKNVVVANTFTRRWELIPYVEMAKEMGVPYKVLRMTTEYENTHGVPADAVARMKSRFEDFEDEILIG